jgi:energy-coupling factor transport system ATP-binding protein
LKINYLVKTKISKKSLFKIINFELLRLPKVGDNMKEIVKSRGLIYEYYTHNERGEIEATNRALDRLDLDIKQGEFVVILGHNGSGKSTLAKHMNAILHPTGGTLLIKGMDTKDEENLWDIRQTAGMVFQNPDNQIIAAIVEEDVAFGPENLGVEPGEIRKRVDEAVAAVQMTEYMTHSPNLLSGGQKQRIAIAGVLAMKPECIILDEPTAMLDPLGRKEVLETVYKLNKEENITIIHITHYMEEAINADRVIVMDHGQIVMDGKPKEVFSQVDKLKSLGLDVPPATELAYYMQKEGIDISTEIISIEEMVDKIWQLYLTE